MAKLSSAPASDAPAASARATRQMRSRTGSVEPEPEPEQASTTRRANGRGASDKNNGTMQSAKRRRKAAKVIALSTVDEEAADEDAAGEDSADGDAAHEDGAHDEPRRTSGDSAISGTTAKTSFTQEEAEQLDRDVMIDIFPDLAAASDKLAQFLVPAGIKTKPETWKEIRTPGSKHHKQYNNRIATINTHKPNFGSQEYIRPKIVLRVLLGEPSGMETPGPWRPDNIIYKINLAQMLNSLLIVCDPGDWTKSAMDALERLDVAFPACVAGSQFSIEALEFYLQFAAQLTIARLQTCIESGPQTSLDSQIDSVFYDESNDFRHAEALGIDAIVDEHERSLVYNMVDELVAKLKRPFEAEGVDVDPAAANGQLKDEYRWDMLKEQIVGYYLHRSEYLDRAIRNVGGVSKILKGLTKEAECRANSESYEQGKERFAKLSSTPRTSLGGGMSLLKKRLSKVSQQPAAPMAQMIASTGDVGAHDFAGDHQLSQAAPQNLAESGLQETASDIHGLAGFQAMQQQQSQQSRQNSQRQRPRWTDPQPGAVRISAIEDDIQSSQPSSVRGKRTHAQMDDFEPTQDEEFQTDTRDISGADQRRREIAFDQYLVDPVTGVEMQDRMHMPSSSKRQRLNPGSAIPEPTQPLNEEEGELDASGKYYRAKTMAKYNRVAASQAKPTKARQPWTDAEETALIELIVQHGEAGVSYSGLKAIDLQSENEMLHRRSAEDLRFKARNMKLTFLKGETGPGALPKNWEYVKLDKKAMDQLASLGIKYDQERSRGI